MTRYLALKGYSEIQGGIENTDLSNIIQQIFWGFFLLYFIKQQNSREIEIRNIAEHLLLAWYKT